MNTDWCYSGYGWRVYKQNSFVGYVVASYECGAYRLAQQKYGEHVRVEKIAAR
jgi:hypothetical protein